MPDTFSALLFAASSSPPVKTTSAGSSFSLLIFIGVLVGIFWLLVMRPQRNRQRAQQELTSQVQPGDEVVTIGGMVATVVDTVGDDKVVLLVTPGVAGGDGKEAHPVEMTFLRQAIARKLTGPATAVDSEPGDEDDAGREEEGA